MEKDKIDDIERMKRQTIQNIGKLIEGYMKKEDIDFPEFAKRSGVSERTIKYFVYYTEEKKPLNPKLETLKRIYYTMGISDWLAPDWE